MTDHELEVLGVLVLGPPRWNDGALARVIAAALTAATGAGRLLLVGPEAGGWYVEREEPDPPHHCERLAGPLSLSEALLRRAELRCAEQWEAALGALAEALAAALAADAPGA